MLGEAYNTPGAANAIYVPPPEVCGDPFTRIYSVQGSGAASPLVGSEVAVEGIVVGDFQNNASPDNGNLNGFHIQDPLGDGDRLARTESSSSPLAAWMWQPAMQSACAAVSRVQWHDRDYRQPDLAVRERE